MSATPPAFRRSPSRICIEIALSSLVDRYGTRLFSDPPRLRHLLDQACPAATRDVGPLMTALAQRVPQQLTAAGGDDEARALQPRLVSDLFTTAPVDAEAAAWAVHAWAHALALPTASAFVAASPPANASVAEVVVPRAPVPPLARQPVATRTPQPGPARAADDDLPPSGTAPQVRAESPVPAPVAAPQPVAPGSDERPRTTVPESIEPALATGTAASPRSTDTAPSAPAIPDAMAATTRSDDDAARAFVAPAIVEGPAPPVAAVVDSAPPAAAQAGQSPGPDAARSVEPSMPVVAPPVEPPAIIAAPVEPPAVVAAPAGSQTVATNAASREPVVASAAPPAPAIETPIEPPAPVVAAPAGSQTTNAPSREPVAVPPEPDAVTPDEPPAPAVATPVGRQAAVVAAHVVSPLREVLPVSPTTARAPAGGAPTADPAARDAARSPRRSGAIAAAAVAAVAVVAVIVFNRSGPQPRSVDGAPVVASAPAPVATSDAAPAPVASSPPAPAPVDASTPVPAPPPVAARPEPESSASTAVRSEPQAAPVVAAPTGDELLPVTTIPAARDSAPKVAHSDRSAPPPAPKLQDRPNGPKAAAVPPPAARPPRAACTQTTCGTVVAMHDAGSRGYEMIVRLDDRSIHAVTNGSRWRTGTRVRMVGGQFVLIP